MRLSGGVVANLVAWGVIALLIAGAVFVAQRFGFAGLVLLGGTTWLVCTRAALGEAVPVSSTAVFRAAMERARSPEERAAAAAAHAGAVLPLRFYGRCGAGLALVGAAGFAWQVWGP